jgi:osomolarity two-component system sensor histidine kinase TcsA
MRARSSIIDVAPFIFATSVDSPTIVTLSEVKSHWVQLALGPRSIDEAFEAFPPIPSVLIDSFFRITHASTSYLTLHHPTLDECLSLNIYDLVKAKPLIPSVASLQVVLRNAVMNKNIYMTSELQAAEYSLNLHAMPIFEQDTLLYILLEVQGTTAEHRSQ